MIELTRLNGSPLFVNGDLIKWAEAAPDTMLTLIHGEKLVVHESCAEVVERLIVYRARLLAEAMRLAPDTDPRVAAAIGAGVAAQTAWTVAPASEISWEGRSSTDRDRPGEGPLTD